MEADSVILSILLCIIYVAPIVAYVVAFIRPKALPWFGNFMLTALPIALIIWIIASCWVGIHYSGLPSLNIFLNLLCVAAVVLGIVYMKRNKRLGFYAIIMSVLLHVGSSFLTKFDSESVITVIVIDAILLVLFVLTVFLKNKDGIRLINLLSPYSEPALTTTILRVYNIVAVVVFIFIMFLFPTWRSARDRVSYFHTYYNTYEYYDNDGKWYDTQRNWVFSPSVDGQRLVSPGYYYVHSRYKKTVSSS